MRLACRQVHGGLSATIRAEPGAPPMFLVHAWDDPISDVDNTITMYKAMKKCGVSVQMHLYATGGHGFGVRRIGKPCDTWMERCVEWLRALGVMKQSGS